MTCFASTAKTTVLQLANFGIGFIVLVSMWAMSSCFALNVWASERGVFSPSKQAKVIGIYTPWIVAKVVNGDFIGCPLRSSNRNVSNEELIRKPVRFELPFVVRAKSFDDYSISKTVFRADPIPTTSRFIKLDAVCESVKQWKNRSSGSHANKYDDLTLKVNTSNA